MRLFRDVLLTICVMISAFSCQTNKQITKDEELLINSGGSDTPFRVLLTANEQDSLFLRQKCTDINLEKDKEDVLKLIQRLKATLEAEQGVGIAAPQVGIARNLFLFARIDKPDWPVEVVINPRIISHPEEFICFERDGCLSIPDKSGNSYRYPWIEVEYTNEHGKLIREKLEGYSRLGNFTGIIFQHEYDHLQGILFIDKLCEL